MLSSYVLCTYALGAEVVYHQGHVHVLVYYSQLANNSLFTSPCWRVLVKPVMQCECNLDVVTAGRHPLFRHPLFRHHNMVWE